MNPVPWPVWVTMFAVTVCGLAYGLSGFLSALVDRDYPSATLVAIVVLVLSGFLRFWWLVGFGV